MNIDRLQAAVRAKSLHPDENNIESWQGVYIQWCLEKLDEDYGTLDGIYWGALNPMAIDPEFPEVFEAMSSQVLAVFVREHTEAIDRLKDGMEQLFEGKEGLGRELFLDGLKGIQILERFLRSEFQVAQSDLRELSLTLNRVLCEWVVTIV
ncbi:MAG: hypothetical protein WBB29_19395 [Geitlerinemataceae cyanobacterium]